MPPIPFDLYGEWLVKRAFEDIREFTVGGRTLSTINYADDLVVLFKTDELLQSMLNRVFEVGENTTWKQR